ncbi:MAG: hypothetical protein MK135_03450 [Polyangiaceae bacterium]|nr:hypothetical protein [Polyangiaceae bacterium]
MTSFSPLQLATLVAVLGSLAAVFIPQFSANFRASRIAEPLDGLQQISQRAAVLAAGASVKEAYPPSAPLTPAEIPQGELVEDPVGTWSLPTWQRLGFSQRSPHAFSFEFESRNGAPVAQYIARARGDLDGDGVASLFEISGRSSDEVAPETFPVIMAREVE